MGRKAWSVTSMHSSMLTQAAMVLAWQSLASPTLIAISRMLLKVKMSPQTSFSSLTFHFIVCSWGLRLCLGKETSAGGPFSLRELHIISPVDIVGYWSSCSNSIVLVIRVGAANYLCIRGVNGSWCLLSRLVDQEQSSLFLLCTDLHGIIFMSPYINHDNDAQSSCGCYKQYLWGSAFCKYHLY